MADIPQRDEEVQRIILIEGSVNLLVLIAKVIAGFTTGSLAIIGDAIHSLTDIVNNIIAWIVFDYRVYPRILNTRIDIENSKP